MEVTEKRVSEHEAISIQIIEYEQQKKKTLKKIELKRPMRL